jgi:tripartite-type tricarboxylate transporter receptor subunit TctC
MRRTRRSGRRPAALATALMASLTLLLAAGCAASTASGPAAAYKAAASGSSTAASGTVQGPSFAGKTATIVVNFPPGGPVDLIARLAAKDLPALLPGHPTVVVKNMPGAGGEVGSNYMFQVVPPDGLTVGLLAGLLSNEFLGDPGVKYNAARFGWLGVLEDTNMLVTRTDTATTPAQLLHPLKPLIVGGFSPSSNLDITARLALGLIGAKYRYVTGYQGTPQVDLALKSGEVNTAIQSVTDLNTSARPLMAAHVIQPLFQFGVLNAQGHVTADPAAGGQPLVDRTIASLTGKQPQGAAWDALLLQVGSLTIFRSFVAPPGTPQPMVQAWRSALARLFAEPSFQAQFRKQFGEPPLFSSGADAASVTARLLQQAKRDTAAIDLTKKLARTKA